MDVYSKAAIVASHLIRTFPGIRAVDDLSFDVRPGEIFGLVGPDGEQDYDTSLLAGVCRGLWIRDCRRF
jgi:ABC-type branched-subunit amino acid transport system ATPase component